MNEVLKSKFGYTEIIDTKEIIDKTMVDGLIEKAKDVQSFCRAYGADYKKLTKQKKSEVYDDIDVVNEILKKIAVSKINSNYKKNVSKKINLWKSKHLPSLKDKVDGTGKFIITSEQVCYTNFLKYDSLFTKEFTEKDLDS